jgi:two-component system response regulator FimZ (fimbrial Z protein)
MGMTVLVVDDHAGFRACARRFLEGDGCLVVGEAADGASAVMCARDLCPDVALVDVHLPDCDGFDVAARMAALERPPAVVLTSSHDRSEVDPLLPRSAARGFVPKEKLSREAIEELLS